MSQQSNLFTFYKKQTNLVETIGEDIEEFSDDEPKSKQNSKGSNKPDVKSAKPNDQNKNIVNQKQNVPVDSPKKNPPQINNQNMKKNIQSNEPIDLDRDENVPSPKRVQWYWRADNGVWEKYDIKMGSILEEAWQNMQQSLGEDQHTVPVDKQRYVDLDFMLQRRFDNPTKTRPIKREGPTNTPQPKPQNKPPIQQNQYNNNKPNQQNQGNLLSKLKQAQNQKQTGNDNVKNVPKPAAIKPDPGSDTDEMDDTQVKNAVSQIKSELKRKYSDVAPAKNGSGSDTDPLDQIDIIQKPKNIKPAPKDEGSDTDELADADIKKQLNALKAKPKVKVDNGSDTDEMDEDTIKSALKPKTSPPNNKPMNKNNMKNTAKDNNNDNNNGGEALWSWLSDNAPVPYDASTSQKLEKAYKIKMANGGNGSNLTVRVDAERYVDIQKMMQCRIDDPLKMRKVIRRTVQEQQKQLDFQKQKQNFQKNHSNAKQGTLDKTFQQLQNKFKQQINTNTAKSSGQWFWLNDSSDWQPYSEEMSKMIEAGFLSGKSTVKIDAERFVDIGMMLQKRYDNPNRSRYITRRTKNSASPAKPAPNKPNNFPAKNNNNNNNFNKANNNMGKAKAPITVDSEEEEVPLKLKKSKSATITPAETSEDPELTPEMEEQIEASIQYHNIKAHLKGSDDGESSDEEEPEDPKNKVKDPQKALELKRQHYKCGNNYLTLDDIPTLVDIYATYSYAKKAAIDTPYLYSKEMNSKVSLLRADITSLEIDAIVNAAKPSLLGGGGIDGAIHAAAGKGLLYECMKLDGCEVGSSKMTGGHKLPAKHVIHTVGPIGENREKLKSCYLSCLELAKDNDIKAVAFCGISTGIYGYPKEKAAHVALRTVRNWLDNEANMDALDRVIFCVFLDDEEEVYSELMPYYFPSMEAQDDD